MDNSLPAPSPSSIPEVSIVIPARNEETSLGACLESLASQTGVASEIIVVDDGSTDNTREIARSFSGVLVISAPALPEKLTATSWTGKNNALVAGAKQARAEWLLFTDADTVHLPGSLARALAEAKTEGAGLLSYSPEQTVVSFAERAVMPVVFAELAMQYPPKKVRDQNSGIIAANGQFILVRRAVYDAVGGHAAVASEILEDVALARLFRNAGKRVYFRYGGDAVRTRMYRNWTQLREGWTKNLALLFPRPGWLAFASLFWWLAAWLALGFAVSSARAAHFVPVGFAFFWLLVYGRIRVANFTLANNVLAMAFGLPIFAYLLVRSKRAHANGRVIWKGRAYNSTQVGSTPPGSPVLKQIPAIESHKLRTGN